MKKNNKIKRMERMERIDELDLQVGQKIRKIRKEKGWRIDDLILHSGIDVTRATISNIETGKQSIYLKHLYLIVKAFNITLQELFSEAVIQSKPSTYQNGFIAGFKKGKENAIKSIQSL